MTRWNLKFIFDHLLYKTEILNWFRNCINFVKFYLVICEFYNLINVFFYEDCLRIDFLNLVSQHIILRIHNYLFVTNLRRQIFQYIIGWKKLLHAQYAMKLNYNLNFIITGTTNPKSVLAFLMSLCHLGLFLTTFGQLNIKSLSIIQSI